MFFTCPGPVARGGEARATRGRRRPLCIDVHCHVHDPPADDMVKDVFRRESEPSTRFTNALSRETNRKQAENVLVCLTSVLSMILGLNAAKLLKITGRLKAMRIRAGQRA